jgi:uncharacterized lipoprotein
MKTIILLLSVILLAGCGNNSQENQSNSTNAQAMGTNAPDSTGGTNNVLMTNSVDTNNVPMTNSVDTNSTSSTNASH